MSVYDKAQYWQEHVEDLDLKEELNSLLSNGKPEMLEDAFYQELSFGTAGLRGIIGAGTNRMNIYTVGRATQGLANHINTHYPQDKRIVAIARDSRHLGEVFVKHSAGVLAANGIKTFIYPRVEPTPALSFAVRSLNCAAGICMTASHNPASYNGYKVYGPDGCQITSEDAISISNAIAEIDPFTDVRSMDFDTAYEAGLIEWIGDTTLDEYIQAVISCSVEPPLTPKQDLSIVYTPLCGTGLECIERVLAKIGINSLHLVESQAQPNGDFPTCEYPNPEERAALEEGIKRCKELQADLLLATDPDADRVGVAVAHKGEFALPTGNEIGILLFDYLCKMRKEQGDLPEGGIVVSTIVSTDMIDAIAHDYEIEVCRTLTGFKYIGDIITTLERSNEGHKFIFGFEESYGYLSGTHVRDKDAINAGMLIVQMLNHYKQQGIDLIDALKALYDRYGYYANRTINIAFPGAEGAQAMKALMQSLRSACPTDIAGYRLMKMKDYEKGIEDLPSANVVELQLSNAHKVILRPSGTEPKIKIYLFAKGNSSEEANSILDELEAASRKLVKA